MSVHHHCCHHHSSGHCASHQHSIKQSNVMFRPGAGHGAWLPTLLPLACAAGSLTDASLSQHISQPLTLLAIQSCIYCYFLGQEQMLSKTSQTATEKATISKSSALSATSNFRKASLIPASRTRDANPTQLGIQQRSSLIGRSAHSVASLWQSNVRPQHQRRDTAVLTASLTSPPIVLLNLVTIFMVCYFSDAGLLAVVVASAANLSVQATVARWLIKSHSSTFSPGEWLMAGQFAGVSVSCSLLSLLSACPREAAYAACQLNTFLQLAVILSACLLLLFLALPAPHSSSLFTLLPLTLAVGAAGVLWGSLMLGEFVPSWLCQQMVAGAVDWSGPLSNASGCGSGGLALSGRSQPAWWFGHADNTSGAGIRTWWGGGKNSWCAYLFGGAVSRWWGGGGGKQSWFTYLAAGGFLWGGGGGAPEAAAVVGWRRPLLLLWWATCTVAAWAATRWVHSYDHVSVSVLRKLYHLVAVLVFVAGVLADPAFLKMATVAATIACLLLEVVRVQKVPGVSSVLTNAFSFFLDEKDSQGTLILSHIYLLVGLSLPLWIPNVPSLILPPVCSTLPPPAPPPSATVGDTLTLSPSGDVVCWCGPGVSAILVLAGVLAVGIGDTFASVGGIRFGRHKWPRSKKTMEGSVCGVLAQVVVVMILVVVGGVAAGEAGWWAGVVTTMVVCGAVEAFTDQVDNLVLPLLMFCGLNLTEYFTS